MKKMIITLSFLVGITVHAAPVSSKIGDSENAVKVCAEAMYNAGIDTVNSTLVKTTQFDPAGYSIISENSVAKINAANPDMMVNLKVFCKKLMSAELAP